MTISTTAKFEVSGVDLAEFRDVAALAVIERRVATGSAEVRAADATNNTPSRIIGYGVPFDNETIIRVAGGVSFRERILPGAFRSVLGRATDTRCLFNHDKNMPLGRVSNGTLRLSEDDRGLRYEVDVNPADSGAVNVMARVARGDVSGSSFGFRVAPGGDEWTRSQRSDELPLRTIREIATLEDVGPVVFPAYPEASAEARDQAAAAAVPPEPQPEARADGAAVGDESTAEETACMNAMQAVMDVSASAIAALAPLLADPDCGAMCREAAGTLASAMAACGRTKAACGGQTMDPWMRSAEDADGDRARRLRLAQVSR